MKIKILKSQTWNTTRRSDIVVSVKRGEVIEATSVYPEGAFITLDAGEWVESVWVPRERFEIIPQVDDLHNHEISVGKYGGKSIKLPAYLEAVEAELVVARVTDERVSVALWVKDGISYRAHFPKNWSVYQMAMWLRWYRRSDCDISFRDVKSVNVSTTLKGKVSISVEV